MSYIKVLDDVIANQIAAGEVVERPASIVKELVENAIDANSTKIDIYIEEGGLQRIRVKDDGLGIVSEDLPLAFERHATSKIRSGRDLFHIRSLGFRGEALPSIAAVSKLTCTSISAEDPNQEMGIGTCIRIEGGKMIETKQVAHAKGTDFIVDEVFYNTPARLKYMKSIQTELGHITDYVYRLSLAYPHITFMLKHNNNTLLQTLGNRDLRQVIASIYGTSVARAMVSLQGESLDYEVSGFIARPEVNRANRQAVSIIANGRYIRNYALTQAVLAGYHTLLPIHRFPIVVLHLTMDPSLIDVNVHPSKLEVRFSKEQELKTLITDTIKEALRTEVLIPAGTRTEKKAVVQEQLRFPTQSELKTDSQKEGSSQKRNVRAREEFKHKSQQEKAIDPDLVTQLYAPPTDHISPSPSPSDSPLIREETRRLSEELSVAEIHEPEQEQKSQNFPTLYPMGQVKGTYIVAQNEEGVYLIDQHAAHERINYEQYFEQFGQPEPISQELLLPITLEFPSSELEVIMDSKQLFEEAGVSLEPFGGQTLIVRSYPAWFPQGEEQHFIEEMIQWVLDSKGSISIEKIREKAAISCACKASIKANESQSIQEMEALLARLAVCDIPYTCPHGRPIMVHFSNYELEKMFKRVM